MKVRSEKLSDNGEVTLSFYTHPEESSRASTTTSGCKHRPGTGMARCLTNPPCSGQGSPLPPRPPAGTEDGHPPLLHYPPPGEATCSLQKSEGNTGWLCRMPYYGRNTPTAQRQIKTLPHTNLIGAPLGQYALRNRAWFLQVLHSKVENEGGKKK